MTPEERKAKREYMRDYRARTGGTAMADKALSKANAAAVKLLRETCPDLWRELLADARASLGMPIEEGPGGNFTKDREHGTVRGYRQHQYRGEDSCDPCKAAWAKAESARHRRFRELHTFNQKAP
jgi:hypothetical protein